MIFSLSFNFLFFFANLWSRFPLEEHNSSELHGTAMLPPGMRELFRGTTKSPPAQVVFVGRDQTRGHMTEIVKQAACASKTRFACWWHLVSHIDLVAAQLQRTECNNDNNNINNTTETMWGTTAFANFKSFTDKMIQIMINRRFKVNKTTTTTNK